MAEMSNPQTPQGSSVPAPGQQQIPVPAQPVSTSGAIPPKKPGSKKALLGCAAAFVFLIIIALVLTFIFLGAPDAQRSPLAEAVGVDPLVLVDTLTIFVRIFFLTLAFIMFIMTMVGIFKISLAKKDDPARNKNVFMAAISAVLLIVNLFLWGGSEVYLYYKKAGLQAIKIQQIPAITTIPENLRELSAPIAIQFDATGAEKELSKFDILNYEWNFGDSEKGNGKTVSHEYKDKGKQGSGLFTAKLTVKYKDKSGKEFSKEYPGKDITIVNLRPQGEIKVESSTGEAPFKVEFDASNFKDTDGKIVSFAWDFEGTGTERTFTDTATEKATHTFNKPGEYTVQLKVKDNRDADTIIEQKITVIEATTPRPVIKFTPETSGKLIAGKQYLFDAGESTAPAGTIQKYEWDFGDNTAKVPSKSINHTYSASGTYEITLSVTDDKKQTGTKSEKVEVAASPKAPVAIMKTTPAKKDTDKVLTGRIPFAVKFDAASSVDADNNIIEYQWDFNGDSAYDSYGPTVTHTYTEEGTYTATLLIIDADNNESKAVIVVEVKPAGIQANVQATPVSGAVPLSVSFDASGSTYPNGKITSYEWDFGDGTPKRLDIAKLTYKYSKIGSFTAKVTAIGADNSRDTTSVLVTVTEVPLKACFEVTKHGGLAPLTVVFTATCSTGTIKEYKWDFNSDGTVDERGTQITHIFENAGTYNVNLEISDNSGVTDTAKDTITVTSP
ncbi:PKD domain-containing protein [Candidatus Peregrinibacteria bacterium]|nr:PKD domain-containing protein [Candidatus Peregrinibacteria bacterium]